MTLPHMNRRPAVRAATLLVTAATLLAGSAATAAASPPQGVILSAGGATAIANSYLVTLRAETVNTAMGGGGVEARRAAVTGIARDLATRYGARVERTYAHALYGFEVVLPERAARRLAADAAVAQVEQNHRVSLAAQVEVSPSTQVEQHRPDSVVAQGVQVNPPSWGLDRIDQRYLPLDQRYVYPNTAPKVHAYVIDTGIRSTHVDFGGRVLPGVDFVDGGPADDCNGHGTFLAGVIGGRAHGVAKEVQLVPVRTLDCNGSGSYGQVIAGVDWVTANAKRPAVVEMGLGGTANSTLDHAITYSISTGITYVVSAGSSNGNACNYSPARVSDALTVGSTTQTDARHSASNYGTCLDIFAPGINITSTWNTNDTATITISGTAPASAHVAGCAAVVAQAHPEWSAYQIAAHIKTVATAGVVTDPGAGSPNRLLYCVV